MTRLPLIFAHQRLATKRKAGRETGAYPTHQRGVGQSISEDSQRLVECQAANGAIQPQVEASGVSIDDTQGGQLR